MTTLEKIKFFFKTNIQLPDKIFMNNKYYTLHCDYTGEYWYYAYFDKDFQKPTVLKQYFIPYAEHENYKKARKLLYKKLDAARAFYPGIDEALNNLA